MSWLTDRTLQIVIGVVLVLSVSAIAVFGGLGVGRSTEITVTFPSSTGLYVGDEVRVLGVPVGEVTSIDPRGNTVAVGLSIDDSQPIPASAKAAIVAPNLVSGRFVQLAPAYTDGARMASGSTIPVKRTAVPVTFDEVKEELTELSAVLGPDSDIADEGALNQIITRIDANLGAGTAGDLRTSISAMRTASEDLSEKRGDLFATIKNLNTFTKNLVINDASIRGVSTELTRFSDTLDDNKKQLATTISTLEQALILIEDFVRDNSDVIDGSVKKVGRLSKTIAGKTTEVATTLQVGPDAAEALQNSLENQAVTGRMSLASFDSIASLVCGALLSLGDNAQACRDAIGPMLELLGVDAIAQPEIGQTPSEAGQEPQPLIDELDGLLGDQGSDDPGGSSGLLDMLPGGAS